jgi:ketosteroid isomerase-like protein
MSDAPAQAPREAQDALAAVRQRERDRIEAIRRNDVATMASILDDAFIHINSSGKIYDKAGYIRAVETHQLTYSGDVDLTETDHRVDGDLVIVAGLMLGHARLDGDAQVYHLRSMRVWRRHGAAWKLLAWQSSALW